MSDSVVIGFGTSTGVRSKILLEEKYHVIERINSKASVSGPRVTVRRFGEVDLGIFKGLISKRRNQMLLESFIGLNEAEGEGDNFADLRYKAIQQIQAITEELNTISFLTAHNKQAKFIAETGASEREAEEYMQEFGGVVGEAISVFNQRKAIITKFAEKHRMPMEQAKSLLKDNNYIPEIFD